MPEFARIPSRLHFNRIAVSFLGFLAPRTPHGRPSCGTPPSPPNPAHYTLCPHTGSLCRTLASRLYPETGTGAGEFAVTGRNKQPHHPGGKKVPQGGTTEGKLELTLVSVVAHSATELVRPITSSKHKHALKRLRVKGIRHPRSIEM